MLGTLFALAAGITWGVLGWYGSYFGRLGLTGNEIAFIRLFFAFLAGLFYLISSKDINKRVGRESIKYILAIGAIQGLMNISFYKSVLMGGTVIATVLYSTGPAFTLILSILFLNEKEKRVIPLLIAFIGIIVLVTEGNFKTLNFNLPSVIYGILSGFLYGLYPIFSKKIDCNTDKMVVTVYSFIIGLALLLPFVDFHKVISVASSPTRVIMMLSFGIIPTIIPYVLFLKSMEYIDVTKASIITMVEVPISATIGVIILKENFSLYKLMGILLVFLAVYIINMKPKKRATVV